MILQKIIVGMRFYTEFNEQRIESSLFSVPKNFVYFKTTILECSESAAGYLKMDLKFLERN